MKRLLICTSIFLAACAGLKREPSSLKKTESLFNLINSEEALKYSYNFDLINLYALNDKKVVFKNFHVNDNEAKKAVEVWLADLNGFLTVIKDQVKVRVGTREVQLKERDLTRLQQALTLLSKSGEAKERIFRKQVELITAFNQNFKDVEKFNYAGSTIPLEFSATLKKSSVFSDSSFWQAQERNKISSLLEVSGEELSSQNCAAENAEDLTFVKLNCGSFHFRILPQVSPKVAALNSILYRRFGFNSAPIVYVTKIPVRYDRKLLPAFRKLDVPVSAVLKTGDIVSYEALLPKLLPYCSTKNESCFSASALFDSAVESQIDGLLLSDLAVNIENGDHIFGSWAYDELDHLVRPEVKALFFISAFTGNTDLRKESNAVIWSAKNFMVSHQIQNLNSGLGGIRPGATMNLNAFPWQVLKSKKVNGNTAFVFDDYRPSVKRQAFSNISVEDAKWAVRMIAGLSEKELTEALALSGFSAAELLLAREKLLSIQKNLVETFGLNSEFGQVAERKIEKNLNYRLTGQPALFEVTSNRRVEVPEGTHELFYGVLKKGLAPTLLENKRKISNAVDE